MVKNSNVMTEEILKDIKTSLGLDDVDEAIPYINQCIQARDRILSDEYSDFKPGSLVLDTRDNEIGFVIGPINMYGDINTDSFVKLSHNAKVSKENTTMLVVTRVIGGLENERRSNFRVRYVKRNYLTPLKIEENNLNYSTNSVYQILILFVEVSVLWNVHLSVNYINIEGKSN